MRCAIYYRLFILFILILIVACGGKEMPSEFQQNEPSPYDLTKITVGYGAVEDAYNSIDGKEFNTRLKNGIDETGEEFELSSYTFSDILTVSGEPLPELVRTDAAGLLKTITDSRDRHPERGEVVSFYQGGGETYTSDYYTFFDKLSANDVDLPPDYLSGMIDKLIRYFIDSIPENEQGLPDKAWLNEKVGELVEDLQDDDFQDDFILLTELLAKLLIQTDYPIWVNESQQPIDFGDILPDQHTDTGLGNAVQGTHDLFLWLNKVVRNSETRELLHAMLQSVDNILDPSAEKETARKLRNYVENLEAHFTIGGEVYGCDPAYSENSGGVYSDAELNQSLREMLPMVQQLFLRSDRPHAMIADKKDHPSVYPLDLMAENLRGIGFDPDTIDVERSIYDLLRYDIWGRDRVTDPDAWPSTFLESLLFLTQVTSNHGWRDGGDTSEVEEANDSRDLHGHGAYAEELTLNDSLFSMNMPLIGGAGVYDLTLKDGDGNHIYRSKTSFTLSEVDQLHTGSVAGDDKDYRFFFNSNYGVLQFLAGPGPGDLGAPDGGNPDGQSLGMNQYFAYAPNGLHETQMAAWTMGWGVRTCFGGEGPYYYADPGADTVMVDGQPFQKYLRPNGKVYALVSADGSQYFYPTDEGDTEDLLTDVLSFNGKRQRDNRYKSSWESDYYLIHFSDSTKTPQTRYATVDNSSGDIAVVEIPSDDLARQAGRLTYNETVAEDDPKRACASPQEAFFRNYQWTMTEKKMVLVIPMYMNFMDFMEAAVIEVMESNGWSGLANLRKYGPNHVWAKKGGNGVSNIPGDYRMEFVSLHTELEGADAILGAPAMYEANVDCGNATPAVVGHNLPALVRLGFPRSSEMTRAEGLTDKLLGSQEFEVGDENWENRNAFAPLLFSLLAGLRDYTPPYDPEERPGVKSGMRAFLNQTALIIKPLFYYNYDNAMVGTPHSWIPRVYGTQSYGNFKGKPFLQTSADFYTDTPETWFGSWEERRHYQPAVMKTQLNILIDSDLTDPQRRCDGILPLVTETKTLSNLLELLLHPDTGTLPLEQILTAMKFTKGRLTALNEAPESGKGMDFPEWMFAEGVNETRDIYGAFTEYKGVRDADIILDDLLDFIIGRDSVDTGQEGYGLAHYPDDKSSEEDWQDFYDTIDTIGDLLHEESPSSISNNLLQLIDRLFAGEELYTSEEISGLLYGTGKLFGFYDNGLQRWVYQGEDGLNDLYNMLVLRIPALHETIVKNEVSESQKVENASPQVKSYGDHYYSELQMLAGMTGPDGLLEFLFNTVNAPQNWETIFSDLNRFMAGRDISASESEMWPTLAQLLREMGQAVGETQNSNIVDEIISDYGFQVN